MSGHGFDRRSTDLNVKSLAERIGVIEVRIEVLEQGARDSSRELRANTIITKKTNLRTEEMWEIFEPARNGFRMIASIGNIGVRVLELGGKIAKPLLWIGAFVVAVVTYAKSGHFTMPDWPP